MTREIIGMADYLSENQSEFRGGANKLKAYIQHLVDLGELPASIHDTYDHPKFKYIRDRHVVIINDVERQLSDSLMYLLDKLIDKENEIVPYKEIGPSVVYARTVVKRLSLVLEGTNRHSVKRSGAIINTIHGIGVRLVNTESSTYNIDPKPKTLHVAQ